MTNTLETARQALVALQATVLLVLRLVDLAKKARARLWTPAVSYENVCLDLTLNLQDSTGRRASLERRQRVLFRTNEAGVVRSSVWGDGRQLQRLRLSGATRLGIQSEGSRTILLLGLDRSVRPGDMQEVRSRETLSGAFLNAKEYFEASVERPTRRLRLQVLFPRGRPPLDAYLDSGSHTRQDKLPIRLGSDGRARVAWSLESPRVDSIYSLRWSW